MVKEQLKLVYRAWKYRWADRVEIAFLLSKIRKGYTALDIGAHKGGYTFWMKKAAGPAGKVVAFEPQAKGAALLKKLFKKEVEVEALALSDHSGESSLFVQPQFYDVSFEASLDNRYPDAIEQMVRVETLDDYIRARQDELSPRFIKIDVEGHELAVIRGAVNTLKRCRPALLIEVEVRHAGTSQMQQLFEFLGSIGYSGHFYRGGEQQSLSGFDALTDQDIAKIGTAGYINNFMFE